MVSHPQMPRPRDGVTDQHIPAWRVYSTSVWSLGEVGLGRGSRAQGDMVRDTYCMLCHHHGARGTPCSIHVPERIRVTAMRCIWRALLLYPYMGPNVWGMEC